METGILNRGEVGGSRAVATFPSVTPLPDGSLLASYRVGSTKDSDDETVELCRSTDGGRTWGEPVQPFSTEIGGQRGSLKLAYLTSLGAGRLVAAAMWVDREAYPGKPLFNEETEGCLPMKILLAESSDAGQTWTAWRLVPMPAEIGPPSLTSPLMVLPSGRWALSIETNKTYLNSSQWCQRVVYLYSENQGRSWSQPVTVSQDPTARIFYWDQRAGVTGDGVLVTFSWTYDRQTNSYLNIHRRLSRDEGRSWTLPEDLGVTDQAAHPGILPDGRVLLSWVDRFKTQSIRARLSERVDAPFGEDSEVVVYQRPKSAGAQAATNDTGHMLADMGVWSYGLPFVEALPNGDALVVYYAGSDRCMDIHWARLNLNEGQS